MLLFQGGGESASPKNHYTYYNLDTYTYCNLDT